MTVLTVAPHVDVTVIDGQGLVASTPAGEQVFSGAEFAAVGQAIDGARSADEILAAVPEGGEALQRLRAARVVVELDGALPQEAAGFWSQERVPPRRVAERLASVSVAVKGSADTSAVEAALAAGGVTVADDGELTLVLVDDYLAEGLAERNAQALETGTPWMLARPAATEAWVGPVFVPDHGPCWECLAQRLRLHRPYDRFLQRAGGRPTVPRRAGGSIAPGRTAVAGIVAGVVIRWIVLGEASGLSESLLSVDTRHWQTGAHALTWRPQCRACGDPDPPESAVARPLKLAERGERIALAGTLRTTAAEATIERFARHVSPITGIADRLVRTPGARPPLHTYLAGDPGPAIEGEPPRWMPSQLGPAGGKGTTDEQARASALCEALERYSGRFGGDEPRRNATFEELGDAAVHPNSVFGFSDAQYADREATNAASDSGRTIVPKPFDPAASIDWTPAWSLTAERERLLPTALCYYDAHVAGHEACVADSNGNAAGNTIEEAILQGFLELVERDHVALWWYNRLRAPAVDLAAIGDPWVDQLQARFDQDGSELWALDLTADLGIPVVAALATPPGDANGHVALGFGAHFELGLAAQRAATELVQLSAGVPSAGLGHGARGPIDPEKTFIRPLADLASASRVTLEASGDLRALVDACVELLAERGLELIVLDQTRADVGLPVVKVVVPGLRHFWPRFGPGRLYEVPVALGRLGTPLAEHELNPVPPVE